MAGLSLVVDDVSLLLILLIVILMAAGVIIGKAYQPLVHPLILARQSDVSAVRHKGQSPIYRNANSPAGFETSSQPRKAIVTVHDVVRLGSGLGEWKNTFARPIYGQQVTNNQIATTARNFGRGLSALLDVQRSDLKVAVCVELDSLQSLQVILSGDAQAGTEEANRYATMIVAPAHLKRGYPPTSFPAGQQSLPQKTLHAVYTTVIAIKRARHMPIVGDDTIFIFRNKQEADEAQRFTNGKRVFGFDQVIAAALDKGIDEENEARKSDRRELGRTIHSAYWTGQTGWVEVSNASLVSGLTAQIGFFPADLQPSQRDHILIEQAPNLESPSLRFGAAATPAGLTMTLLALYFNAALTASTLTSSYSDWNPTASEDMMDTRPTMIIASPAGASSFAASLCTVSKRSPLAAIAAHTKLSALRNGTFTQSGLWDSVLFNTTRLKRGAERVRSVMILTEGPNVSQGLLDVLRAQLGCSVRLSYLPSGPLRLFDEKLTAGVGSSAEHGLTDAKYALPTAAISATHSLDLQAFTADHSDKRQLPAHVGAPNVTIALKLVQSDTATAKGFNVDGVDGERDAGRADDPFGEIFVRGNSIAGATSAEQWCATGDLGTVRSNGTLVVVQDHQKSVEVDVPTLSSEYPSARRASRIGAGGAPTRIVSLTMLLACTLASLCVMPVDASASLHRRAEGSINSTFVQTSVMAFMSAQRASWEQGVAQSALLEYNAGSWSVFSGKSAPPYVSSERAALPSDLLNMAFAAVKSQNSAGQLCSRVTGDESLTQGSALDPASCGELVLLAAYAQGQVSNNQVSTSGSFGTAAQRQLNYLLNTAPRNPSGAISMRSSAEAYWSDGVYMAPPFIALYGLMTENQTLLQTAYDQVRLYRDALRIPSGTAQGLFYHIVNASAVGGAGQDLGAWLTGNAWSAAGMCRVLAAISQSRFASSMSSQINDLVSWTNEIVSNALDQGTPLMHNYVNETDTFLDAGGSAMIAYSTYRLAAMSPTSDLGRQLAQANAVYDAVQDKLGQDGQLISGTQVVDPLGFVNPSQGSPEGMSFMVLLSAARRDRAEGNVTGLMGPGTGSNDASTLKPSWVTLPVLSAIGVCSLLSAALL